MSSVASSDDESEAVSSTSSNSDEVAEVDDQWARLASPSASLGTLSHELTSLSVRLKLSREQRLRKLLSQRSLGQPRPVDGPVLVTKTQFLSDDDAMLVGTFSNSALFDRLCNLLERSDAAGGRRVAVEEALSQTNPLFRVRYTSPIDVPSSGGGGDGAPWYSAAPDGVWWETVSATRETLRHAPERGPEADTMRRTEEGSRKRAREANHATSASAGLVAQSAKAWEAHLATELSREGETLDSFRQGSNKTSYMEKTRFKQQAEQNEYQRELTLQAKARDLAEKRAIRRGETSD